MTTAPQAEAATVNAEAPSPTRPPFVSIIVPVYNGRARLGHCLRALEAQTYPKDRYEVIVVDNGSDEPIDRMVAEFGQARLVIEAQPGSYAARNKGVATARGEVIAFTDADCIPASDWLSAGVEALLRVPGCGLVAGRVQLFFRDPARPTAAELYSAIAFHRQHEYVHGVHFGETANLFTFRSVFEEVGLFDATLRSHGDVAWGKRVFRRGYQQVYAPEAWVAHPATHSLGELGARVRRLAGGLSDMRRKEGGGASARLRERLRDAARVYEIARRILSDERLERPADRIRVLLVMLYVLQVASWETARVQFGGASTR